jgi:hypothetical protein
MWKRKAWSRQDVEITFSALWHDAVVQLVCTSVKKYFASDLRTEVPTAATTEWETRGFGGLSSSVAVGIS